MKPELCIFNLNGVVVDTSHFHYLAWKELAYKFDFDLTSEYYEKIKGFGRIETIRKIMEWVNVEKDDRELESIAKLKNDHFVQMIQMLHPSEIKAGVKTFLSELKKLNIKTALASASKNTKTILNKLELYNHFNIIVDGDEIEHCIPDPEIYLKCALSMNVAPSKSVVFEDAINGIIAAKSADFYTIGIGKWPELNIADIVIPNLKGFNFAKLMTILQFNQASTN